MNSTSTEITVVGEDDTGLLARTTSLMFEYGINIEDLDQVVRDGLFRMTMRVDISTMKCSRDEFRADFHELCEELGVDGNVRFANENTRQSLAVLVTKESHCLEALLEADASGRLDGELGVVISNHSTLEPLVEEYGVPFYDIGDESGTPDEDELLDLLEEHGGRPHRASAVHSYS